MRHDAWGQQVEAKSGATSLAVYKYDALGRVAQRGTYKRYYSDQWQVLWAEGTTGSSSESAAHVWSPVYVDALVLHDRDIGLNGVDSRWYASQDANWNVTSVTDQTGAVLERFVYDAYGKVSYLSPAWASIASSTIQSFVWGFQGLRLDGATGAWHARNRELSPTLGRFYRQDPARYVDGVNLYAFVRSNPTRYNDPRGHAAMVPALVIVGIVNACIQPAVIAADSNPAWGARDKVKHCYVSCMIARNCGSQLAMLAGTGRELGQALIAALPGGDPLIPAIRDALDDEVANAAGRRIAGWETALGCGNIGRWFRQSCAAGCEAEGAARGRANGW